MLRTGIVHPVNIEVRGSGGPGGWPAPGCRCASCQGAAADGRIREPFRVLVDGVVELSGAGAEWGRGAGGSGLEGSGPEGPGPGLRVLRGIRCGRWPEAGT